MEKEVLPEKAISTQSHKKFLTFYLKKIIAMFTTFCETVCGHCRLLYGIPLP
jgi:hypothetical protein